jgi:hypothetical protein
MTSIPSFATCIFVPSHEKCFLNFQNTETEFFCEVAIETRNRKLGTTPHINNKPSGIHISALVSLRNTSIYVRGLLLAHA